jgi:hypothetical protein
MKPNNRIRVSFANRAARMVAGGYVVLSFFSPLILLNAAASPAAAMACCIGKASGHCSSGLLKKARIRPKPEQMCGAKSQIEDDGITVVATSSSTDDASSFSAYVVGPCAEACCAAFASSIRQPQPREHGVLPAADRKVIPLNGPANRDSQRRPSNSDEALNQSSPRGPPFSLYYSRNYIQGCRQPAKSRLGEVI